MRILACSFALAMTLFAARSADAQTAVGIRGGVADDPDYIFLGMHIAVYDFARVRNFHFEPSLELGIGDEGVDFFTIRGSGTFSYRFPVGRQMTAYPLGGLSIFHIEIDDTNADDTDVTIHLGGGFGIGQFNIELWLNVDNPDINLTFAYTF